MTGRSIRALLALLLFVSLAASPAGAVGMDEIERCIARNAPEQTMVQDSKITSFDRNGADRTQEAKIYWKRDKDGRSRVFIHVEAPPDLRGSSFLMIQREGRDDEMWMYLPALEKVRRITPRTVSGQLFGTDFSYEDIQHIQLAAHEGTRRRLADAQVAGRATYVLESEPAADSGSSYSRIVSFVDHEFCIPLKTEFYDGATRRKVMTADPARVTREGETWVPRDVTMKDLERETESRLEVKKVSVDTEVPDRRFTLSQLERGR